MDKSQPYDEPLDPHWETLNASFPDVEELAGDKTAPGYYRTLNQAKSNVVPFLVRIQRAREMESHIDRAIKDGHLNTYPDLDAAAIAFRRFAAAGETLGYEAGTGEPSGGVRKYRDELLEIYHLAWESLRRIEGQGFPLAEYVETQA